MSHRLPARFIAVLGCLGWVAFLTSSAAAQVTLDRFFPPVVSPGEATEVVAEGKFPKWPPEIRCDRADVTVDAEEKSGRLKVSVPDGSPPGVAWVRMLDKDSASSWVPLMITHQTIRIETEPNNRREEAEPVEMPTVAAGRLAKRGDSDAFRVQVTAGQTLVASLTAHELFRSPMDGVLQLSDLDGNVLDQSDDVRGLDPKLTYRADKDRDLIVRVFGFPETPNSTVDFGGAGSYVYCLTLTTGPLVDHACRDSEGNAIVFGENLPPNHTVQQLDATEVSPPIARVDGAAGWAWLSYAVYAPDGAEIASLPATVAGHITEAKQTRTHRLRVSKGTRYFARIHSREHGFLVDSRLHIVDAKSKSILFSNDDLTRGGYDSATDFTTKADGEVEIQVSDLLDDFGPRHFYALSVREANQFRLTVAGDRFSIPPNKPLELTAAVARDRGFGDSIQISAVDLPEGVTAEPVVSEPKGGSAKSVKLVLKSDRLEAFSGPFRIIGKTLVDGKTSGVESPASFALRPAIKLDSFWLTIPPADKPSDP